MRRILMSLMVIAVAVLAVVGGTFAKFADSAVSSQNTFTAGNVSVLVNGAKSDAAIFAPENIKPGDTGTAVIHLQNVGSVKGCPFDMAISDVKNSPNHSLASKINIEIWEDKNHDGVQDAEEMPVLYNGTLKSLTIESKITQLDDAYVGFKWTFDPDASSIYMDTWCTANLTFTANQP
jgi:predicted ribosomally synthesized peptide with SipW-like signal peptide